MTTLRIERSSLGTCDQVYHRGHYLSYVFEHSDGRWYHNLMTAGEQHDGFTTQQDAAQDVYDRHTAKIDAMYHCDQCGELFRSQELHELSHQEAQ